ncbi:uncharacterized protein LOC121389441 [Gigantopelta aegis]|uniref:uncharacterized protein LOC121389441 n=1 Tax=Gigantopelta aegis TaxID=1735272 RepID=UPI001B8886ED|nr:uncharacterized protein LOC121389441 [Gigantopelta aegis]
MVWTGLMGEDRVEIEPSKWTIQLPVTYIWNGRMYIADDYNRKTFLPGDVLAAFEMYSIVSGSSDLMITSDTSLREGEGWRLSSGHVAVPLTTFFVLDSGSL